MPTYQDIEKQVFICIAKCLEFPKVSSKTKEFPGGPVLGLFTFIAGGIGSSLGQKIKISEAVHVVKKKKKANKWDEEKYIYIYILIIYI